MYRSDMEIMMTDAEMNRNGDVNMKTQKNTDMREDPGMQTNTDAQAGTKKKEDCCCVEEEMPPCCCSTKTKERSDQEYKDLLHRLNRIEGQIRGIKGMVEKDAYCTDILIQVSAVNAALNSFNKVLLANHIKSCVTRDIKDGKEETVDELVEVLQKLMK